MSPEKKRPAFKIISAFILFCLIFNLVLVGLVWPKNVKAQLEVFDPAALSSALQDWTSDVEERALRWADDIKNEALKHTTAIAFRTALVHFLRTLSMDVATWIASGGKGQQPMFITKGWGAYLTDVADSAAGEFIETFATLGDKDTQYGNCYNNCGSVYQSCLEKCKTFYNYDSSATFLGGSGCEAECIKSFNSCDSRCSQNSQFSVSQALSTSGISSGSGAARVIGFLCQPSLGAKLKITMGLAEMQRPRKPSCAVSSMLQNWDQFVNDPNFLQRFQSYFDPYQSDLGIALTLQSNLLEEQAKKELSAAKTREEGEGFKSVTDVSDRILTPAWMVKQMGAKPIEESISANTIPTGDIIADAIATFASTLIGQLFQRWIKEGMVKLYGQDSGEKSQSDYSKLYEFNVSSPYAGAQAAKARFMKIFQPTFTPGGKYEVLQKLASCSDYNNPGPDECVITEKFRAAIEKQMTVKEAIEQGYLDGGLTFGFNAQGYEPPYNQGYPYRTLIILRKHRVISVGWELAAYWIGNFQGAQPRSYNLNDIINAYDDSASPFYHLVDPGWVLKAHEGYCRKEAPGEKITSLTVADGIDTNKDNKYDQAGEKPPQLFLTRADYCADDQGCIMENSDGTCKYYGYCAEEKRQWRFSDVSCESKWASCQTFQSRLGQTVSYLKNTLDFNGCSQENYGCGWYCQNLNPVDKYWDCLNSTQSYQVCQNLSGCVVSDYLTGSGKSCVIPYEGVTCVIPTCQTQGNLVQNGDFEKGSKYAINNWTTSYYNSVNDEGFHKDGAQKHNGANSLMFYAINLNGTYSATQNVLVKNDTTYDISGWVYNGLNQGSVNISATVNGAVNSCGALPANGSRAWQQFNCTVASGAADDLLLSLNINNGPINGSIWFDEIKLQEQCSTEPIRLFLNQGNGLPYPGNSRYFDHDIEICSRQAEGCSEFLRIQANSGANLLPNGNFEEFSGTVDDGIVDNVYNWQPGGAAGSEIISDKYAGSYALKVSAGGTIRGAAFAGAQIYGRHFVLSLYGKNCQPTDNYQILGGSSGISASKPFDGSAEWKRYTLDYLFPTTGYCSISNKSCFYNSDCPAGEICEQLGKFVRTQITAGPGSANCVIDNIQIEEADSVSSYKDYGAVDLAYLKKAQDYYKCYDGNPANDFAECQNYALSCAEEEVGCQKYTPLKGDPPVPGVVKSDDYCPAECVDYDTYKQKATFFEAEPATLDYFIPKKQKSCSSLAEGCSEFTNLDEVAKGGEGREYYTYLRQCVKPDATCATFYSWIGSEQSGYQLKGYSLVDADADNAPDQISNPIDLGGCNNVDDAVANPECKEFYSASGIISYQIYRNTIACSQDCHSLRISQSVQSDCGASGGSWDGINCVYNAIPKESYTCSAAENGCREYKGNTSYNKMTVVKETFEQGVNNWGDGVLSGESLTVGGHSLNASNANISYNLNARCVLGAVCADVNGCLCQVDGQDVCLAAIGQSDCVYKQLLNKDRTYLLSFWAKGQGSLTIKFASADCAQGQCFSGGATANISLTPEWRLYNLGPVYTTWDPSFPDGLGFSGFGPNSYIDNIILTEARDDIFVIKTTPWQVPVSCDQDQFGGSSPQFTLGCKTYKSSQGKSVNLKSFSNLCGEDKVGCEALIDTHNSTSAFEQIYNYSDQGEAIAPADEIIYLVNNSKKSCKPADKGCQIFGLPELDQKENVSSWDAVYLKNDPDKYNQILCKYSELGCEQWKTAKGDYYFKDPKNRVCEYKLKEGEKDYGWYKVGSEEKCKTNNDSSLDPVALANELGKIIPAGECLNSPQDGKACSKAEDCYLDLVNDPLNFPDAYCSRWTGQCPTDQSSCAEFIDPASSFSKNLLFNGNFSQDVDANGADGWSADNNATGQQEINLEAETLYTISAATQGLQNSTDLRINFKNCLDINNSPAELTSPDNSLNLSASPPRLEPMGVAQFAGTYSARFYTGQTTVKCAIELPNNFKNFIQEVSVRESGLYYYLTDTTDQTSCNGLVNFEDGCVLFNKRDMASSSGYANLLYDADTSASGGAPNVDCGGNTLPNLCDANALLKVRPDRVCDKWLYCRSSIETRTPKGEIEKNCLDVGLCDGINERGECDSFPQFNLPDAFSSNLTYNKSSVDQLKDLAGYVKVGYDWGGSNSISGYRLFSNMPQVGGESFVANGNFEESSQDSKPYGWVYLGPNSACNLLKVIDNPVDSQKEGLGQRAVEGRKFLQIANGCNANSELLDIVPGTDNVISAWFNTLNLGSGGAQVIVQACDNSGNCSVNLATLTLAKGLGWTFKNALFTSTTSRIKITILGSGGSTEGRFYVDDVKISAVLNHQDPLQHIFSSCRGYPDEQALSCDYKEESGNKKFGWWGYCLENDRKPANPDQCLIWWPVDIIKGKGLEEGIGYNDRYPLYYCLGFWARYKLVEYRQNTEVCYTDCGDSAGSFSCNGCGCDGGSPNCPNGYTEEHDQDDCGTFSSGGSEDWYYCHPAGTCLIGCSGSSGWYEFDGDLQSFGGCDASYDETSKGLKWFDPVSGALYDLNALDPPCSALVQTVTQIGQQKAWAGRVFEGSNYAVPDLNYKHRIEYQPFAGVMPMSLTDPTFWSIVGLKNANLRSYSCVDDFMADGDDCDTRFGKCSGESNLICYSGNTCANPAQSVNLPFSCPNGESCQKPFPGPHDASSYDWAKERVKRLFAKSYGGWSWNGSQYVFEPNYNWTEPTTICPGIPPIRPAFANDFCVIPPLIEDIKVDGNNSGNVCIKNNGFISLTFNSVIDADQLPMVAYSILWGDGDANSVSGVSMQSKPNPDNPHSLHHLYGYWDLKAKDLGMASIECNTAGKTVFTAACPADSACCAVQPKIQIKDNWGWCNNGSAINDCDAGSWDAYNGYIIVAEKNESECL